MGYGFELEFLKRPKQNVSFHYMMDIGREKLRKEIEETISLDKSYKIKNEAYDFQYEIASPILGTLEELVEPIENIRRKIKSTQDYLLKDFVFVTYENSLFPKGVPSSLQVNISGEQELVKNLVAFSPEIVSCCVNEYSSFLRFKDLFVEPKIMTRNKNIASLCCRRYNNGEYFELRFLGCTADIHRFYAIYEYLRGSNIVSVREEINLPNSPKEAIEIISNSCFLEDVFGTKNIRKIKEHLRNLDEEKIFWASRIILP